MVCGKNVDVSGYPGQFPPTARFKIKKEWMVKYPISADFDLDPPKSLFPVDKPADFLRIPFAPE